MKVRKLEDIEQRLKNTLPGIVLEWERGERMDDMSFLRCRLNDHSVTVQKSYLSSFGVTCSRLPRVNDLPDETYKDGKDAVNRVVSLLVFNEFTNGNEV